LQRPADRIGTDEAAEIANRIDKRDARSGTCAREKQRRYRPERRDRCADANGGERECNQDQKRRLYNCA
jgi:hypothetical protein